MLELIEPFGFSRIGGEGPFPRQQDGETIVQLLPPWVALGNKELHLNRNTLQQNVGEA
jgi:hypothetical protein